MEADLFLSTVKLTRNPLGGHAVEWNGKLIGWIHASYVDKWNAFSRGAKPGDSGTPLGRFTQNEAVRRIATEAGWPGPQAGQASNGRQSEERSVMAELLTPQEVRDLQVAPGRWLLPGTPP